MLRPAIASSNPTSSKTFNAFEDDAKLNTLRGGSTSVGEHLGQGRYKFKIMLSSYYQITHISPI